MHMLPKIILYHDEMTVMYANYYAVKDENERTYTNFGLYFQSISLITEIVNVIFSAQFTVIARNSAPKNFVHSTL